MTIILVAISALFLIVLIGAAVARFSCQHQWEIIDMGTGTLYRPNVFGPHTEESVHKYSRLCKVCSAHEVYYR